MNEEIDVAFITWLSEILASERWTVKYLYINFIPDCCLMLPFKIIGSDYFLKKLLYLYSPKTTASESDIKQFYIVIRKTICIFQINAVHLNFLNNHRILGEKCITHPTKTILQQKLFSTLIIIGFFSWAADQYIKMILKDHVTLKTE